MNLIRMIVLFGYFSIAVTAYAGDYLNFNQAKNWLSKNKKCSFSAVKILDPKTDDEKRALAIMNAKSGQVDKINEGTAALCVFDGVSGKGAAKQEGCFLAWYLLDRDQYRGFKAAFSSRRVEFKKTGQKCSRDIAIELLTKMKNDEYRISVNSLGSIINQPIWPYYIRDKMIRVEIINDDFDIKSTLNAIATKVHKEDQELAKKEAEKTAREIAQEEKDAYQRMIEEEKRKLDEEDKRKALEREQEAFDELYK